WPRAAIGVRQEPSRAASIARSAATQAALPGSWSGSRSGPSRSSAARHSIASAPWPTAGSMISGDRISVTNRASPSRSSPHSASTSPSTSPASSLPIRVFTLPRIGTIRRSGRRRSNCAWRRSDAVPMLAPLGKPERLGAFAEINASRGSSRGNTQAISSPSGSQVSTSFSEWTARSIRPASNASSISLVKRPLPPISPRRRSCTRSPVVRIVTISTAPGGARSGWAATRRSRTSAAWRSAIGLPRVPMRSGREDMLPVLTGFTPAFQYLPHGPYCYIILDMPDPVVLARPPAAGVTYLAGLNEAQRRAVEAVDGPVLVLAGAGTGKTRVLTTRLAYILGTGRAFPAELLAVTFTNKAAREMRERLEAMVGRAGDGVWLGTFHAIASRILRRHAELVGLKSSFTILDTDDQIRLLKQILQAENIDERRWPARLLLAMIQRWKDRGLGPEKVGRADAVDFGDLLLHNLTLLTGNPDVLADYQRRFRYLLVDEYQDTNVAQYLWLRLLAQQRRNLCCVSDDDQSIYSWRGAEIGNILRFENDFPGATITRLEQNYRSTSHILGAAAGMIAQNRGRLGKTLWTQADEGDKVVVRAVWDALDEARWVGEEIEALQRKGHALSGVAILVRAAF